MASARVFRAVKERGPLGAFQQFWKLRTFKFGKLVGVDSMGNHYYENAVEYPAPQHRWVEHAGLRSWYEIDASEVCAEWHGWLHGVTDDPPTTSTVGTVYKMEPEQLVESSDNPYSRNLGSVVTPHVINQSQRRSRGYGLNNGMRGPLATEANEETYYTQPGWPLDPRHVHPRKNVAWTLTDTPDTLNAARERMLGRGTMAALDTVKEQLLTHGDSDDKAVAVASAGANAEISAPSASSAATQAVRAMRSEESIRADMIVCQGVIDEYSGFKGFKDAETAVARAQEELAGLEDELAALFQAEAEASLE